jgi:long-chain acyl-CoA synthetase
MTDDVRNGVVGPPLGSVEIKLGQCPEVMDRSKKPYLPSDTMHYGMPCAGRGEVLIRGPSVSAGYFKQPDKTAEVFDKDGWFHSGDVGLMTTDGAIMIVDRVKNLVKLKGGEYIALEAMEKEYGTSAYVNGVTGGIMCYGDGDIDRPVALVQANTVELEKWAKANGVQYKDVGELCKSKEAVKLVLDSLVAIGKASSLGSNEILCAIALIPGTGPADGTPDATSPWTPENGSLTASNKLNRNPIRDTYISVLEPLRKQATR